MLERRLVVVAYTAVGALGAGITLALGHDPLRTVAPTLGAVAARGHLFADGVSALGGLGIAAAAIVSARIFVARFSWARALHESLAGVVRGTSDFDVVIAALASGIGEELLCRGLLTQTLGVVISSVIFGALHQVRGPARLAWALWAGVMGLLLGGLFVATGSLVGPIVAHVVTNAINLRFVRDHNATPPPRTLASLMR